MRNKKPKLFEPLAKKNREKGERRKEKGVGNKCL
jgi:hypothetical protein